VFLHEPGLDEPGRDESHVTRSRKLGAVFEERLASLPAHGVGVKQVGRQRHNDGRRHVGHAKHRQRAGVDILEGGPNVEIRVTTHLRDELPGAEPVATGKPGDQIRHERAVDRRVHVGIAERVEALAERRAVAIHVGGDLLGGRKQRVLKRAVDAEQRAVQLTRAHGLANDRADRLGRRRKAKTAGVGDDRVRDGLLDRKRHCTPRMSC